MVDWAVWHILRKEAKYLNFTFWERWGTKGPHWRYRCGVTELQVNPQEPAVHGGSSSWPPTTSVMGSGGWEQANSWALKVLFYVKFWSPGRCRCWVNCCEMCLSQTFRKQKHWTLPLKCLSKCDEQKQCEFCSSQLIYVFMSFLCPLSIF